MTKEFLGLFLPLIISNILHMVVVKYNLFRAVKIPLSQNLFGANKTYRGFIVVTSLNSYIHFSLNGMRLEELLMGAIYGLVFCLSELPNSFIKRSLNIKPGEKSRKYEWLQFLMDKMDSALGVALTYCLINSEGLFVFLIIFFFASSVHMSLSYLVYKIGLKESL